MKNLKTTGELTTTKTERKLCDLVPKHEPQSRNSIETPKGLIKYSALPPDFKPELRLDELGRAITNEIGLPDATGTNINYVTSWLVKVSEELKVAAAKQLGIHAEDFEVLSAYRNDLTYTIWVRTREPYHGHGLDDKRKYLGEHEIQTIDVEVRTPTAGSLPAPPLVLRGPESEPIDL